MARVLRSVFGCPIETEAIINKPEIMEFSSDRLVRREDGFLYTGADTGGFMEDATEDLLLRWLTMSVFFRFFIITLQWAQEGRSLINM